MNRYLPMFIVVGILIGILCGISILSMQNKSYFDKAVPLQMEEKNNEYKLPDNRIVYGRYNKGE